jgi:hypothetical protein
VKLNLTQMMKAKETSVSGLTKGIEYLFKKNGVDYVKGTGTIIGENEIKVNLLEGGEQTLRAKNIIIATGSEATPFPGLTIDEQKVVTSTGAIALQEVPKKMVVIGGGIIGLEMVGVLCAACSRRLLTLRRAPFGLAWALRLPWSSTWAPLVDLAWMPKWPRPCRRSSRSRASSSSSTPRSSAEMSAKRVLA